MGHRCARSPTSAQMIAKSTMSASSVICLSGSKVGCLGRYSALWVELYEVSQGRAPLSTPGFLLHTLKGELAAVLVGYRQCNLPESLASTTSLLQRRNVVHERPLYPFLRVGGYSPAYVWRPADSN